MTEGKAFFYVMGGLLFLILSIAALHYLGVFSWIGSGVTNAFRLLAEAYIEAPFFTQLTLGISATLFIGYILTRLFGGYDI